MNPEHNVQPRTLLLERELEILINSYQKEGLDIREMKKTHNAWEKACKYMRRNKKKEDNSLQNENNRIIELTKEVALKYEKILNMRRKIRKLARQKR